MPISNTREAQSAHVIVRIEWVHQLRSVLREAESLLREHAADQSYTRDLAPNAAAKMWHENQSRSAVDVAGALARWMDRLDRPGLRQPSLRRMHRAVVAAEAARDALQSALDELRPVAESQRKRSA